MTIRRWERGVHNDAGAWVGVLGGRSTAAKQSGPLLSRCGWPSPRCGPAYVVAFDECDLVVIRRGIVRVTRTQFRRADDPFTRFSDGVLVIEGAGTRVEIPKGPGGAIAWYLAAAGWRVDPAPPRPSLLASDELKRNVNWPRSGHAQKMKHRISAPAPGDQMREACRVEAGVLPVCEPGMWDS